MTTPRNDAPWAADPPKGRSLEEEMAIQLERGHADGAGFLDGLSDEDLAEFALALEVQAELEAQDAAAAPKIQAADSAPVAHDAADPEPGVIPLRRPERAPRRLSPRWVALAAVLAGVMLLPFAWRATQGGAVREPSQAVAMLENPEAGLPAGWDDNRPWSGTRGACEPVVTEAGRAVRLGAYMVNLELAVRARDAEQTRLFIGRAECLVQDVTAGGLLTPAFRQMKEQAGSDPSGLLPHVESANETAADLLDADWFALGAWAEAARLAAARQDAEFFRSTRTRRTLDRAAATAGGNDTARDAVAGMRTAAEADPPQWEALRTASANLLAAVAS